MFLSTIKNKFGYAFETDDKRDHYIDLARGVCVLGIIFIHTCYYSGWKYVPFYMRQVCLLLDVPTFFFISGMTYQMIKKDMIVTSIFKLACGFTLLSLICNFIFGSIDVSSTLSTLAINKLNVQPWKNINDGFWFVPVYVSVIIAASVIIQKIKPLYKFVMIILIIPYILKFFNIFQLNHFSFLGANCNFVYFYLAMFLFGYFCREKIVLSDYRKKFAIILLISSVILFRICYFYAGNEILNLQSNKFPVCFPYIIASMLSVSMIIYFYNKKYKSIFLEYLGKNALFYYMGQGVSSALLFYVVNYVNINWMIKLPIMFILNTLLCLIISELLKNTYIIIGIGYQKLFAEQPKL